MLGFDDEAPQRHAAEHARDDVRLVSSGQVDERVLRLARGVEPACALEERRDVAVWAGRGERPSGLPHGVVQDGLEPAVRAQAPGPPAEERRHG
jgi:hypothetical protein